MPKPSMGAAALLERGKLVLIEAAAGKDGDALAAALIENAPDCFGKRDKIAAIEAHCPNRNPFRLKPLRERHNFLGRGFGIVGVDQDGEILRPRARESLEGRGFARRTPR